MAKKQTIHINGSDIIVLKQKTDDYISLTDMAKYKNAEATGIVSHTGYPHDMHLTTLASSNASTTPILMLRNSVTLEPKPEELQEIIQHQIQLTKQKQAMIEK